MCTKSIHANFVIVFMLVFSHITVLEIISIQLLHCPIIFHSLYVAEEKGGKVPMTSNIIHHHCSRNLLFTPVPLYSKNKKKNTIACDNTEQLLST